MSYTEASHQLISHEDAVAQEMEQSIVQHQVLQWLNETIAKIDLRAELSKFAQARLSMIDDPMGVEPLGIDLQAKLEIPPEHAEKFRQLFKKQLQLEATLCLNSIEKNVRQLDAWKK